jgi:hypothetical protein
MRNTHLFGVGFVLLLCCQLCAGRDIYQQPKKEQQQQQAGVEPAAAVAPAPTPAVQPSSSSSFSNITAAAGTNRTDKSNRTVPGMPMPAAGVALQGAMPES